MPGHGAGLRPGGARRPGRLPPVRAGARPATGSTPGCRRSTRRRQADLGRFAELARHGAHRRQPPPRLLPRCGANRSGARLTVDSGVATWSPTTAASAALPGLTGRGTVIDFDDAAGLGVVCTDDGREYGFHCTGIADGSRTIVAGTSVTLRSATWLSRSMEASAIKPSV